MSEMSKRKKNLKFLVATQGRPTKFKPEMAGQLLEYFDVEAYQREVIEEVTEYNKDGTERKSGNKYRFVPSKMPTLLGFAESVGCSYWCINQWAEHGSDPRIEEKLKNNEGLTKKDVETMEGLKNFSKAFKVAKQKQKEFLMSIGLSGASPSAAFIFTAKNITDMRDKVENNVKVEEVKPLLDNLRGNPKGRTKEEAEQQGS